MNLKQKIYNQCLESVNERLSICEKSMALIQESLASETKSSAGDKHETGRAMIQLEREQLGNQLKSIEVEKSILLKINPELNSKIIGVGSLVKTTGFTYFIAISSGKITLNGLNIYCISLQSPIGQILNAKRVGDKVKFREQEMEIMKVE